ncbi:double-strand break repair protein AddB [Pseudoroseicyclus tamaricis]|uniref:double-strand break repair protein AddB n=1 Tax=Pseudoroseicyclus tamaricis TaxID=2705421 RepID=UPI001F2D1492|nr:double-strand break repair protein AddB [Pseudoroseicyclus tamaricis]
MSEPLFDRPGLFTLPPGVDFARQVLEGLDARLGDAPPEARARVTIWVNTNRMARRMKDIAAEGGAQLLPRIRTLSDLALMPEAGAVAAAPPLRRKLELTRLTAALIHARPEVAPRSALFDLADSLYAILAEMEGEGVPASAIAELDVSDLSGHWALAQEFLSIATGFLDATDAPPGPEGRMRAAVLRLAKRWETEPPADPVIVAGSTGSRGAAALLIAAVARLPNGAAILPGFDHHLPQAVWDGMGGPLSGEDHPQYRFRRLAREVGASETALPRWSDTPPPAPERNALLSLALRPAPVTDAWLAEGPRLAGLEEATASLTLLEAPDPRHEAEAIAIRLRRAAEEGQSAALITPDRMLTRRVSAALSRWNITPDDSAGVPLPLTAPGRFLRMVAELFVRPPGAAQLLALLKHPFTLSDGRDRGNHVRRTAALERMLRHDGPPSPGPGAFRRMSEKGLKDDDRLRVWAEWLEDCLTLGPPGPMPLADHVARHVSLAERLAAGPGQEGTGELWDEEPGRRAHAVMEALAAHADAAGEVDAAEYAALLEGVLSGEEARNPEAGHPLIRIWGTLEARVQGADLMILAGLNEASWPKPPAADPWLNRRMRAEAGLLLPERRIGLSAHDFQQAAAGREVWLTRSLRSDEAETVPSRWLNRLTNLLGGLERGKPALAAMRQRGHEALALAERLERPSGPPRPAPRPAPRPPVAQRPTRLSVTDVGRLYSDPYAIYARKVLNLRPLDPLTPEPDARLRGEILHRVFERFVKDGPPAAAPTAEAELMRFAEAVLDADCPWPSMRRLWLARIARVAPAFLAGEIGRQARALPGIFEQTGGAPVGATGITLIAKADRIDVADGGAGVWVYDYKTGPPPSVNAQKKSERQLLLEAALIEEGGFPELGPVPVRGAEYIGLGTNPKVVQAPLAELTPESVWASLEAVLSSWMRPGRGYVSRRRAGSYDGDYDHLARYGEWDESDPPAPEDMP